MWLKFVLPYMLLISTANLLFKIGGHNDVHPLYFSAQSMVFGALALLALSRPGPLALEAMKSVGTWVYAVLFLATNTAFFYAVSYLDIYTAALFWLTSIIYNIILAALFLGRFQMPLKRIIALTVFVAGIAAFIWQMPPEMRKVAILFAIFPPLLTSLRSLTQELHEASNKTKGKLVYELRVTGFAVGVTALFFTAVISIGSLLAHSFAVPIPAIFAPTTAQIFNLQSLAFAIIYGVFLLSGLRFLEFYWIKKIKAETFAIVSALLPAGALLFDWLGDVIGLVPMQPISPTQLAIAAVIIIAALLAKTATAGEDKSLRLNRAEQEQVREDQRIAQHTLEYAQNDEKQAAKLLDVTQEIFATALAGVVPLSPKASRTLHTNFGRKVATADALTGLLNKTYFIALFKEVLKRGDKGVVLYIDLDKFKPVNDTHGHEAGDEVLKIVAERLITANKRNSVISRLGGDEFAVLLTNTAPEVAAEVISRLQEKLAEPIKLASKAVQVEIGASVGKAIFPQDGTEAETLLRVADQQMYAVKKAR